MTRAFFFEEFRPQLSTRQKVEIVYRNFKETPLSEESQLDAQAEIESLIRRDPFLKRRDRQWITNKLKKIKAESASHLALGANFR